MQHPNLRIYLTQIALTSNLSRKFLRSNEESFPFHISIRAASRVPSAPPPSSEFHRRRRRSGLPPPSNGFRRCRRPTANRRRGGSASPEHRLHLQFIRSFAHPLRSAPSIDGCIIRGAFGPPPRGFSLSLPKLAGHQNVCILSWSGCISSPIFDLCHCG